MSPVESSGGQLNSETLAALAEENHHLRTVNDQLRTALDSRVVIEQAKGMLRERLGLPVESAFALLRLAARSSRQKLHDLAADVVTSFSTPEAVVRELARRPEFMTVPRGKRIVKTKEFFRQVNDAITHNGHRHTQAYVCECANPYCTEKIDVTAEDVQVLHSVPGHYLILPGHEIPDFERVVHTAERYAIVSKDGVATQSP